METDIIIIGAGAAGLAAAYELSLVNKKIIVLEARNRIGGRIHTIEDDRFSGIVETGAEFIHGRLPVTLNLLEKANLEHHTAEGRIWEVEKGKMSKKKDFIEGWNKLIDALENLEEDISFSQFLNRHFKGDEHKDLRESALKFVEGYHAADSNQASSFALREEWKNEDDDHQGRLDIGYIGLMNFLANQTRKKGNQVLLSSVVDHVQWQKGKVEVNTTDHQKYSASQLLLTIPLGVWQAEGEHGHVRFTPRLSEKNTAAQKMGFGSVIKINFQFQNNFWEEGIPHKMNDAGFIFSDADFPTWWTQHPVKNGQLTGWLAGPKAMQMKRENEKIIFQKAINSLAYIFNVQTNFIREKLVAHYITDWTGDVFARGAYSYATLDTHWAKKTLAQPVEQTLFFAGEALYNGTATGTVEAALASGIEVAREMIVQAPK